jgi:hypothetical protein
MISLSSQVTGKGPMMSPAISAQTLTLTLKLTRLFQVAWELSHTQCDCSGWGTHANKWNMLYLSTMLNKRSSPAGCWCHSLSHKYICSGLSWSISRTFGWDSPNSHALSPKLCVYHSIAAIMAYLLAGVYILVVCGQLSFLYSIGITLPVSQRCCFNHWNTLASGGHQPG